ncbi:MAG: hypothetical protein MRK01_01800 [Candidatus Scalindua sp.]|nr:hypothetical protein [Candidatus Scalindua sp.]
MAWEHDLKDGYVLVNKKKAEVCLHCGERLYAEEIVRSFEEIRKKLKSQELSDFKPLVQSVTVSENWPNKSIQPT